MRNMNEIVGGHDIVFIVLDTLRYDVAQNEMRNGRLPVLSQYFDEWEKRHAPGSFTYASHQAMFSGFFPTPYDNPAAPRPLAVDFAGSVSITSETKCFDKATIVEGLASEGYHTVCIGGVGFFSKKNSLSSVLPGLFLESHWSESMGVTAVNSTESQVNQAIESISQLEKDKPVFLFMNVSAIHQPNYFYNPDINLVTLTESQKVDDIDTHAAALRYVDSQLQPLFDLFKKRRSTLFYICSDHGTTYGEGGYSGHRLAHEVVWTVPYTSFIQGEKEC